MVNTSDKDSTQGLPRQAEHPPLYARPLVLSGGVWITLLVVGAVAAKGLLSAGPVEKKSEPELLAQDSIEQAAPDTSSPPAQIQEKPSALPTFTRVPEVLPDPPPQPHKVAPKPVGVPLWLYGAIALGCAAGSVLISLGFKRTASTRKPSKRGKSRPQPVPSAKGRKPQQRVPQKRRPVSSTTRSPIPAEPALVVEPMVTVLPPEESHPLDWNEATLAEMMDLRKRQSLASLLRK